MIKRTLQLLILVCLFSALMYTGLNDFLSYAFIIAVPVMVLCLGYAAYKTHTFYHIKKGFIFLFVGLSLYALTPTGAMAQSLDTRIQRVGQQFHEIWRIPADQRTREQQRQYERLKEEFEELLEEKADEVEDEDKLCQKPHELLKEVQNDCWSCDMTYLIIESIDKVATTFYNEVQENRYALKILALGFAFWLLFKIFKMLATWGFTDLGQIWTDIFKKFLLVIVAAALLMSPVRQVFDLIMTPLFSFSAAYSMKMSEVAAFGSTAPKIDVALSNGLNVPPNRCSYCTAMLNPAAEVPAPANIGQVRGFQRASVQDRAFSPQLKNSMLCIICSLYRTVSPPTIIGQSLACYSVTDGAYTFPPHWVIGVPFRMTIPNLTMWITGYAIIFTFFVISVLFPFYLIDAFFRLGYVATLMPFLIVAYVFEATRKYADNAFKMVLYSLFTFLSMSITLVLVVQMFYAALASDTERITGALAENDIVALYDVFAFASGGLLILMCIVLAYFAYKLIGSIDEVTREISGVNLESTGGIQALSTTVGLIKAPITMTSEIYDEKWGKTGSKREEMVGRGLTDYHSAEAKSRLIRSRIGQRFDTMANKVENSMNRSADNARNRANQSYNNAEDAIQGKIAQNKATTDAKIERTGDYLINKLTNFTTTTKGVGGIIAMPLIGLIRLAQMAGMWTSTATSYIAGKVTNFGFNAVRKTTSAIINMPSKIVSNTIRKTGAAIAGNKYFTKTYGATNSVALATLAGAVLGTAHLAAGLGPMVPGAVLSRLHTRSAEEAKISVKDGEIKAKEGQINKFRREIGKLTERKDLLLQKSELTDHERVELLSIDSEIVSLESKIGATNSEINKIKDEKSALQELLAHKKQMAEQDEQQRQDREQQRQDNE